MPADTGGFPTAADSLLAMAEALYRDADIEGALSTFEAALNTALETGDSVLVTQALTWIGLAEWRLGDYRAARQHGEEALELKLRLGLENDLSRSYNALGLLAWNEGRLHDAHLLYTEAFEKAEAVGDTASLARVHNNLALNHSDLGDFEATRAHLLASREAYKALGDTALEARVLTNLGALNVDVGRPSDGIRALEEALALYEIAEDGVGEQNALGQLGAAYAALGQPGEAISYLDRSLAMARTLGLRQEEASVLEQLAELHHALGASRIALSLLEDAQAINMELGLQLEAGADLRSEAAIHAKLGNLDYALRTAQEGLQVHESIGAPGEILNGHLLLANLFQKMEDPASAAEHLAEATEVAGALGTPAARAAAALGTARFSYGQGKPREALQVLETRWLDLSAPGSTWRWEAELLRARAYWSLSLPDSARVWGHQAIASVEQVRGNIGSSLLRSSFVEERAEAYGFLVEVLLESGSEAEAFETADGARGRVLLEHILARRGESLGRTEGERTLVRNEELQARISALRVAVEYLAETPFEERTQGFDRELEQLRQDLEQARMEYATGLVRAQELASPELRLLGAARTREADVRQALGEDEALLEYFLGPEQTTLFVLRPDSLWVYPSVPGEAGLVGRIRIARNLITDTLVAPDILEEVLGGLYTDLLGPVQESEMLAGVSNLIIVPDGALNYLPFSALWNSEGNRFVAEEFSVTYLPSAAALPAVRNLEGDPAMESTGGVAFAPFPDELARSSEEVARFGEVVPDSRVWRGRGATEARFREALKSGAIVHVATHGIMDARNPMFSRILFFGDELARAENDGRLEVHEVLGQEVASPLVFLSGCDTGSGIAWAPGVAGGQDYAALYQTFLYAGASNVVSTLWPVQDRSAAEFSGQFYGELRSLGPGQALAETQRKMIARADRSAPYFWAAYTLSGSGILRGHAKSAGVSPVR